MTPEQEEEVARALAETARHEPVPPLPPEVVGRLDDVLADLVAERSPQAVHGPAAVDDPVDIPGRSGASVDELARRRRRWPRLLTAAAAVALVVAAGGTVARNGFGFTSQSDDSSAGRASTAQSPETARDDAAPAPSASRPGTPRLRTSALAADVQRLLTDDLAAGQDRLGPRRKALTGPPLPSGACVIPPVGPGERALAVRLDGLPATLLLGPVRGDNRSAEVYSCGDAASPVAGATVPLR